MSISNLTKKEAVEFLTEVISNHELYNGGIEGKEDKLETAIRVCITHLKEGESSALGTAVDAIFQMYKRDNNIDKSYRNSARFILSQVYDVPPRYESYDEDAQLPSELMNEIEEWKGKIAEHELQSNNRI